MSSSPDRIDLSPDAFLRQTGQLWKLVVGGLVLPFPLVGIGLWALRHLGRDQPPFQLWGSLAVLAGGALLMVGLLASVKCPRCRVRLLKAPFRSPEGLVALTRLLNARSCPNCGFHPAPRSTPRPPGAQP